MSKKKSKWLKTKYSKVKVPFDSIYSLVLQDENDKKWRADVGFNNFTAKQIEKMLERYMAKQNEPNSDVELWACCIYTRYFTDGYVTYPPNTIVDVVSYKYQGFAFQDDNEFSADTYEYSYQQIKGKLLKYYHITDFKNMSPKTMKDITGLDVSWGQ